MIETKDDRQQEMLAKRVRDTNFIKLVVAREQQRLNRRLTAKEVFNLLETRLVCPHCERFALRSKGYRVSNPKGECGHCGKTGPMMTVREYVDGGYYK